MSGGASKNAVASLTVPSLIRMIQHYVLSYGFPSRAVTWPLHYTTTMSSSGTIVSTVGWMGWARRSESG